MVQILQVEIISLFHETVHLWIGENDLYNDRRYSINETKPIEFICNAVAGELMVPENVFLQNGIVIQMTIYMKGLRYLPECSVVVAVSLLVEL